MANLEKLLILVASGVALVACGARGSHASESLVDVGGHRLEVRIEGEGSPAIVLESGIADGMDKVEAMQKRLAATNRVIAYNRAGYGASEAGPLPRDGAREADELKALLDKLSVPGPYVLVGHSLGAMNVMIFASKHPKDVAGIVVMDPPPVGFALGRDYTDLHKMAEGMTATWEAKAGEGAKSDDPKARAQAVFFRMIASEHREMGATAKMVEAIPSFGGIPALFVASGKPNPAFGTVAEEFQKYWTTQTRTLAGKASRGGVVLAKDSSHDLYADAPDLVEATIRSMLNAVRSN